MLDYTQDFIGFSEAVNYQEQNDHEIVEDINLEDMRIHFFYTDSTRDMENLKAEAGDFCVASSFEYTFIYNTKGTWEYLGHARG